MIRIGEIPIALIHHAEQRAPRQQRYDEDVPWRWQLSDDARRVLNECRTDTAAALGPLPLDDNIRAIAHTLRTGTRLRSRSWRLQTQRGYIGSAGAPGELALIGTVSRVVVLRSKPGSS